MKAMRPARWLVVWSTLAFAGPASAQEFGIYLSCKGQIDAAEQSRPAELHLALRRNSKVALISASDVLPAGERLGLDITPHFYTISQVVPARSKVWYDWIHGHLVVWSPHLKRLHAVRLSVDRQSAALQGELRDGLGNELGRLAMRCEARDNETVEKPKF
jgi:hypothetical protein